MGSARTAWHVLLDTLLCQRGPRSFEVRSEVPLSAEPLRPDYLLLRRRAEAKTSDRGKTLRRLWPWLPKDAVAEFKSIGRPYRSRNLHRLWGYLHIHFASQPARLVNLSDLCGVLLVPARTSTLDADAAAQGLWWSDLGGGYWQLEGGAFGMFVAEIDVVAEAENDDLLRLFGHGEKRTIEAERWLAEQVGAKEIAMALHDMEGFDEVMRKLLAKLPPKAVLSAYTQEQLLLALPVDVLKGLSDAYLDSLPEPTRNAIRARLAAARPRAKASQTKAKKPGRARRGAARTAQASRG
jgi:hypothetical protein